jgi:heme-degrading monooxygenase HmoA
MIIRLWHGYTRPGEADAYETLLKTTILPGIHRVKGYQGAYLLRKEGGPEVEFVTLTLWDSLEATREFAGPDGSTSVVPPEARALLSRFDEHAVHYQATWCP